MIFGNLLTLPVGDSLLYIEPFYVRSQTTSGLPQLNYVLVWYANRVGVGPDLLSALKQAVPATTPPDTGTGTGRNERVVQRREPGDQYERVDLTAFVDIDAERAGQRGGCPVGDGLGPGKSGCRQAVR